MSTQTSFLGEDRVQISATAIVRENEDCGSYDDLVERIVHLIPSWSFIHPTQQLFIAALLKIAPDIQRRLQEREQHAR